MKPSIGRIVHYVLSEQDAGEINRRRTTGKAIADRIATATWPLGAQAHIGNEAKAGQVRPMMIVQVWGDSEDSCVNGQVFLDGVDVFWACSRNQCAPDAPSPHGYWFAPPRTP